MESPACASLNNGDEFQYVSYKRKRKKHLKQNVGSSFIMKHPLDISLNLPSIIRNIQDELNCSDFMVRFKEDLLTVLNEWGIGHLIISQDSNDDSLNCVDNFMPKDNVKHDIDIVCYGLGQFSSCTIARYQLGFLLTLKQVLQSTQVHIYDPVFSADEVLFLKELGLNVLDINEEAKRTLKTKSICFLPHCDFPLYNNLLWANWNIECLSKLVIIGNSFQTYELSNARRYLKEKAKYIYLANKFITEIQMANTFRFNDIFNDLSIHYFKTSSLSLVDSFVWTETEEPEYSDAEYNILKS